MSHTCSKGWGARCPASKGPRCKCQCGGHNHGNPKAKPKQEGDSETMELTPSRELFYQPADVIKRPTPEYLLTRDDRVIRFDREINLAPSITLAGASMPRRLVHHSPFGFEFGYGGSGPADLALNILALVIAPKEAMHLHQQFKWEVVAKALPGDEITLTDVKNWISRAYAAEIAADVASESGDPYVSPGALIG